MAQPAYFGHRRIQKGLIALALSLVLSTFGMAAPTAFAEAVPAAKGASAAVVVEASTGRVLYQNNAYSVMPMASTTKILTAITVIRHVAADKVVAVDKRAVGVEGSSIYLREGEQWRVEDLLYGLMLRSGNDAAVQLAITTAGSVEAFAALMNDTAAMSGAYHSHFVNPHGLHHPDHYTTAYDLACITAYAMRDPLFARIVATKSHTFRVGQETRVFVNKNKMLSGYEGAVGVKTGYTTVAGRCLVAAATREGMTLISVVLNEYDMWYRSADLLDAAFAQYTLAPVWQAGEVRTATYLGRPTPVTVRRSFCYPLSAKERRGLRFVFNLSGRDARREDIGEVTVYLEDRPICHQKVYRA